MVIYAAASDFGLADGSGAFDYSVDAISLEGFGTDSTSGTASFDPFHPAVSQGDFIGLAHGDHVALPVSVDLTSFAAAPALGWMVVTMDDANGASQADLVSVASMGGGHGHGHGHGHGYRPGPGRRDSTLTDRTGRTPHRA